MVGLFAISDEGLSSDLVIENYAPEISIVDFQEFTPPFQDPEMSYQGESGSSVASGRRGRTILPISEWKDLVFSSLA